MANRILAGLDLDHIGSMTRERIKNIRSLYKATQVTFSELLGVSYHTYKNWEIGHRIPSSPSAALLYVAENNPKIFINEKDKIKECLNTFFK